jgi:hypothetical protein
MKVILIILLQFVLLFGFVSGLLFEPSPYGNPLLQEQMFQRTDFTRYYYSGFEVYIGYGLLEQTNDLYELPGTQRALFFPLVDIFSEFTIPGSGVALQGLNNSVWVQVNFTGIFSDFRYYKQYIQTPTLFVGSFTLVVTLINGIPHGLSWQDDCNQCDAAICVGGYDCGLSYDAYDCTTSGSICDIKIYVVWQGTDSQGTPLTSSNDAPSQFNLFALRPVWQSAAGVQQRLV